MPPLCSNSLWALFLITRLRSLPLAGYDMAVASILAPIQTRMFASFHLVDDFYSPPFSLEKIDPIILAWI